MTALMPARIFLHTASLPRARRAPPGRRWAAVALGAALLAASLPAPAGPLRAWLGGERGVGAQASSSGAQGAQNGRVPSEVAEVVHAAYGPDAAQGFDVYLPAERSARPKILLMVHGGGWQRGDKTSPGVWEPKVRHWGAQGWIVVSTNYRMVPQADPIEQARDVARALAKVQQLAPGWGADAHDVVLMGHSAGAHLVVLLTAAPQLAREQGAQAWRGTVSLDSGALDVPAIMNHRHPGLYDRAFGQDPDFWRQSSPLQQLAGSIVPTLIVCSTRRQDACPQGQQFAERAAQFGARVQVLPQALSHMDINRLLGEPGAYTDAVDAFLARL